MSQVHTRQELALASVSGPNPAAVNAANAILRDLAEELGLGADRGPALALNDAKDRAASAILDNRLSFGDKKISQVVEKAKGHSVEDNLLPR